MPQQLSSKDASLFRQVVRHYENKQHKKGGFVNALECLMFVRLRGMTTNHDLFRSP